MLSLLPHTRPSFVSVVFDFNASLNNAFPVSLKLLSVVMLWKEEWFLWMPSVCLLLSQQLRLSWTSVMFDFNASLNDVAPVSPIVLSVVRLWKGRVICFQMTFASSFVFVFTTQVEYHECCVWFQCFTQRRCSCVSNPARYLYRGKWKSELLMDVSCVSSFFCLHHSGWEQWVLCLISVLHSVMLLQSI